VAPAMLAAMRAFLVALVLGWYGAASAQSLSSDNVVRVSEFYRMAPQMEDRIWPGWSKIPDPLLLITPDSEFLTHLTPAPEGFHPANDGFVARQRQFPPNLQATFPPFSSPIAVIVIGSPDRTASRISTPWEIAAMHEHFHQLQDAQPGYFDAVNGLGLNRGDKTGMWMLNYAFPYTDPAVNERFAALRDQLLRTVAMPDGKEFRAAASRYLTLRREFMAKLSPDDHKYLSFQLWQEGIARYTQIAAAETAADYQPSEAYRRLPDYTPFSGEAANLRSHTLEQLRTLDLGKEGRIAVYSFGGVEGLLLDRLNPQWKSQYFQHLLTTDPLFPEHL
jgi:hypothetical protein